MNIHPLNLFLDRLDSLWSARTMPSLVGWLLDRGWRHCFGVPDHPGTRPPHDLPPVDVVIPVAPKDLPVLEHSLGSLENLCHPVREVYVVAEAQPELEALCERRDCTLLDETSVLGYGRDAIDWRVDGRDRSGWLLQQLVKLAADRFTSADLVLALDADTVLIRPHAFVHRGATVFSQSSEWNPPYYVAFERIFGFRPPARLSFISHMLPMEPEMLAEMRAEIEERHGRPWDRVFLDTARRGETISSIGEADLYGNWMLTRHPDRVFCKRFYNRPLPRSELAPLEELVERWGRRYESLSFHHYVASEEPAASPDRSAAAAPAPWSTEAAGAGSFALVHLGPEFPRHLPDALRQIRTFNPETDLHVVMEDRFADRLETSRKGDHRLFVHPASELLDAPPPPVVEADADFRGGFWIHTTARFVYLEALMRRFDLRRVVHVENDVLVYFDLRELLPKLRGEMLVTRDAPDRVVGGILFVRRPSILGELNRFARRTQGRFRHDMDLLSTFQEAEPERVRCLPIVFPDYFGTGRARERRRYANDYRRFRAVFDAACIGQYLGGVDPRNEAGDTTGFINETSVFRCDRLDDVRFERDTRGRKVPVLVQDGRQVRVMNLHAHGKNLGPFLSA